MQELGHKATLYHLSASMRKDAHAYQCQCEEGWTLVEKKIKTVGSSLKDQAGQSLSRGC